MICLNMIVKNEAHVVERCLTSVLPYIDRAYILDTGSSDNTIEVMSKWFSDNHVDYRIDEGPFVNFADARTRAIQGAREFCNGYGWALWIDPDDVLTVTTGARTLVGIDNYGRDLDAYGIVYRGSGIHAGIRTGETMIEYPRTSLLNMQQTWVFKSVVHEYPELASGGEGRARIMPGVFVDIISGGARSKDPNRYLEDIAVLKTAMDEEQDPDMVTRYLFLIGQSYTSANMRTEAIDAFRLRATQAKGSIDQEACVAAMNAGKLIEVEAMDEAEREQTDLQVSGEAFAMYLNAIEFAPHRAEPWYYAARSLRMHKLYTSAFAFADYAATLKRNPADLLSEPPVYQWQNDYELSIASYFVDQKKRSLRLIQRLLRHVNPFPLPDDIRAELEGRLRWMTEELKP